jgi:hypothetical protein
MNWFKEANNDIFGKKVKNILKKHPFTKSIADYYHIPIEEIDSHLEIEICDLGGKFAEGNGKVIRIDSRLMEDDFFKKNFHFIIHEFFHWLKRRSEEKFYFNDPEEVQSFVLQMTWELICGKSKEEVIEKVYPIINNHFSNITRAKEIFKQMIDKAISLYHIYKEQNNFLI